MEDDYAAFSNVSVGLLFIHLTDEEDKSVIQGSEYWIYICVVGLEFYGKGLLLKHQYINFLWLTPRKNINFWSFKITNDFSDAMKIRFMCLMNWSKSDEEYKSKNKVKF